MEERRVGEDAVESAFRQIECEEILMPYLATAVRMGHRNELPRAVQADGDMTKIAQRLEVAAWPTAEVENGKGRFARDMAHKRVDVLADVMCAGALPKTVRLVRCNALACVRRFLPSRAVPISCSYRHKES